MSNWILPILLTVFVWSLLFIITFVLYCIFVVSPCLRTVLWLEQSSACGKLLSRSHTSSIFLIDDRCPLTGFQPCRCMASSFFAGRCIRTVILPWESFALLHNICTKQTRMICTPFVIGCMQRVTKSHHYVHIIVHSRPCCDNSRYDN